MNGALDLMKHANGFLTTSPVSVTSLFSLSHGSLVTFFVSSQNMS